MRGDIEFDPWEIDVHGNRETWSHNELYLMSERNGTTVNLRLTRGLANELLAQLAEVMKRWGEWGGKMRERVQVPLDPPGDKTAFYCVACHGDIYVGEEYFEDSYGNAYHLYEECLADAARRNLRTLPKHELLELLEGWRGTIDVAQG